MDLRAAAVELYGALPGDFVATRTRLVRQARAEGDRELATAIGALPKATLAAWAVNLLVRTHGDRVQELLSIGAQLREAQAAQSAEDFRALNRMQHRLLVAVRRQAEVVAQEAGQRLSEPIAQRVQATLHAGMADPWAAEAVRSGVLVADLVSTGFGPVDLSGAIAVPDLGAAVPPDAATDRHPSRPTAVPAAGAPDDAEVPTVPPADGRDQTTRARRRTADCDDAGTGRAGSEQAERGQAEHAAEAVARQEGTARRAADRQAAERKEAERNEAKRQAAEAERRRAESLAAEAEAAVEVARSRLENADAALEELAREVADRDEEIATLTARLRELRAAQTAVGARERRALADRTRAAQELRAAREAAARARAAVPD